MMSPHFVRWSALVAGSLLVVTASRAYAADSQGGPAAPPHLVASTFEYTVPSVNLTRDDGKVVRLADEMNDGRPVVLNFIFTTCSSVCPLLSQVMAQFEHRLGTDRDKVHLMSISIDPEEDTPARLRAYAHKFRAGPEWQHYTGTLEASVAAQRAFDVYRGEKMSHTPVTLVRAAPGQPWLRIDGLVTPDQLYEQYQRLLMRTGQTVATR